MERHLDMIKKIRNKKDLLRKRDIAKLLGHYSQINTENFASHAHACVMSYAYGEHHKSMYQPPGISKFIHYSCGWVGGIEYSNIPLFTYRHVDNKLKTDFFFASFDRKCYFIHTHSLTLHSPFVTDIFSSLALTFFLLRASTSLKIYYQESYHATVLIYIGKFISIPFPVMKRKHQSPWLYTLHKSSFSPLKN